MGQGSKAKHRWETPSLILLGGLVGLFAAVMHNFYDAFRSAIPEGNLLVHVVSGVVIYVLTGALVLGLISAIRNWLMQDR
jgi:H+/Cl- antiporter ClcA